jgi:O-antigen/teichoic acid export membrane protein
MIKSAILILPVMTFLLCIAPELIRILFGKSYEWSAVPFRIYLLNLPIRTITFGAILLATQNSRYILINQLLGLTANAIFGWTLIGVCGPAGAAIGAVLASYVIGVPHMIFVISNKLKIKANNLFPWIDMFKLSVISLIPAVAVSILKLLITLADIYWILLSLSIYLPTILIGYVVVNIIDKNELKNIIRFKLQL